MCNTFNPEKTKTNKTKTANNRTKNRFFMSDKLIFSITRHFSESFMSRLLFAGIVFPCAF